MWNRGTAGLEEVCNEIATRSKMRSCERCTSGRLSTLRTDDGKAEEEDEDVRIATELVQG